MRDLIMGFGNLPFPLMDKFLGSLRNTGFAGDVCIFVIDVGIETIAALRAHGVIVENARGFVRSTRHLMCSRFFMYQDFLSRHHRHYDRVMLTDIRDVIFQSDPFSGIGDADILYAGERSLIRDCRLNSDWLRQAYGDAVCENIADCQVSCAGTTLGTIDGILAYLSAMTDEMAISRALDSNVDQGIHNYVVHMRPLRGAWLDSHDTTVATLHHIHPDCIAVTQRGIEVDGRVVPVIHQWDRRADVHEHVWTAERFRLQSAPMRPPSEHGAATAAVRPARTEAIIAWRRPGQGVEMLDAFAKYARDSGFAGAIAILGAGFAADEVDAARRHGCQLLQVDASHAAGLPEVAAHLNFRDLLPHINADDAFLIDGIGAICVGNPFQSKTIGVSLFSAGAKLFITSRLLCGSLSDLRSFYAALFAEFEGKQHLLNLPGAVQAAFNKIASAGRRDLPVTVHPNGSVAYLVRWPTNMAVETEPVMRVGGAAPAVILGQEHT